MARRRRAGSRRGALGRLHGRTRSPRAPRRRAGAIRRERCPEGGRERPGCDRAGARGDGRLRATGDRSCAAGARRIGRQVEPRRERDPGRLARDGEGRRRLAGTSPLALARRSERARPAHADAERDQRRRPRGQRAGAPGVHADADRRILLLRGPPLGRRVLPRAEGDPARQGSVDRGRGRRWVRAAALHRRRGARAPPPGDRGGRLRARRRDRPRDGSGGLRARDRGRPLPPGGRRPHGGRHDRVLDGPARSLPDRLDRRPLSGRTTGTAGRRWSRRRGLGPSSWATTSS